MNKNRAPRQPAVKPDALPVKPYGVVKRYRNWDGVKMREQPPKPTEKPRMGSHKLA